MTLRSSRTTSVTSLDEARRALGQRLRELRKQSGMTGKEFAASLSWPPSKVSKLETGRQAPTDGDILVWSSATGNESEAEALLSALHTLETRYAEWQRQLKPGLRAHQDELADLDEKTRLFRAFEPNVIPGLLQTAEYARSRFAEGIRVFKVPNDIDAAVRARSQRQEMLYRQDKRFHFVLTEAALRFRLCAPDVMLAQLDRLMSLSTLRNVKFGVISFGTRHVVAPWHGFWLLDVDQVMVETYSAELNLTQPQEIELYSNIFEQVAAVASYGASARAIVTKVMDDLVGELEENGV